MNARILTSFLVGGKGNLRACLTSCFRPVFRKTGLKQEATRTHFLSCVFQLLAFLKLFTASSTQTFAKACNQLIDDSQKCKIFGWRFWPVFLKIGQKRHFLQKKKVNEMQNLREHERQKILKKLLYLAGSFSRMIGSFCPLLHILPVIGHVFKFHIGIALGLITEMRGARVAALPACQ